MEMAIGMYPIPPPDDKTIGAIFGKSPVAIAAANEVAANSANTPTQSPSHSEFTSYFFKNIQWYIDRKIGGIYFMVINVCLWHAKDVLTRRNLNTRVTRVM